MRPQSAKAKGRRLQQEVRDALRALGQKHGLVNDDIESRGMGQSGVDIILSPAARRVFDLAIECKNVETLNVSTSFAEHYVRYAERPSLKLLIHRKNRIQPMVTLLWQDFLSLLECTLAEKGKERGKES